MGKGKSAQLHYDSGKDSALVLEWEDEPTEPVHEDEINYVSAANSLKGDLYAALYSTNAKLDKAVREKGGSLEDAIRIFQNEKIEIPESSIIIENKETIADYRKLMEVKSGLISKLRYALNGSIYLNLKLLLAEDEKKYRIRAHNMNKEKLLVLGCKMWPESILMYVSNFDVVETPFVPITHKEFNKSECYLGIDSFGDFMIKPTELGADIKEFDKEHLSLIARSFRHYLPIYNNHGIVLW